MFDPNYGEYVGTWQEIEEILQNLFGLPFYRRHRIEYARRVLIGVI
ncbi:MAG: hypothetical protein HC808_06055 [Candidatus Competibacteraceae bacterium]|nr:hypothetical protein [Candidatus Competibacteraceae bacterium]